LSSNNTKLKYKLIQMRIFYYSNDAYLNNKFFN
jgi:hypothetical protein